MVNAKLLHILFQKSVQISIVIGLVGCASLLPDSKQDTQIPWHSYSEAHEAFEKIVSGKTSLAELKEMGIDPEQTSNVALLGQADMLRRLVAVSSADLSLLDPKLKKCVSATPPCFAYEIEQKHQDRKRVGNFWQDFLSFKRHTDVSGWQFDAIFVIKDGIVIYKQWSGKPSIHQQEEDSNPLGPLQGIGSSVSGH